LEALEGEATERRRPGVIDTLLNGEALGQAKKVSEPFSNGGQGLGCESLIARDETRPLVGSEVFQPVEKFLKREHVVVSVQFDVPALRPIDQHSVQSLTGRRAASASKLNCSQSCFGDSMSIGLLLYNLVVFRSGIVDALTNFAFQLAQPSPSAGTMDDAAEKT
jgi:hypothetical protein